jgi:uncharacterized hydrophobic protein (TIGR00271 family)
MSLSSLLHGGDVSAEEISRVRETVVFEPPELKRKLIRFWILLMLAAAISTYGLIGDSVATVIGAMIVAPLMLPIMGLAFGISLGDGRAIGMSLLVGAGGIITAIVVGYVLSLVVVTASFDPEQVGQVMSRTSPGLLDLLAALATGLAGAFAIGRKDVSDTLPGVAIAISLVPPLANAGILLAAGRPDLAQGSVLLFVTNYLAIVLTGAFVFGLMGYPRVAFVGQSRRKKRIAVAAVILMSVLIALPLGAQSFFTWVEQSVTGKAGDLTEAWLEGSDYRLVSAEIDAVEQSVRVVVEGSGQVPAIDDLQQALAGELFGAEVLLEVVPAERYRISTE